MFLKMEFLPSENISSFHGGGGVVTASDLGGVWVLLILWPEPEQGKGVGVGLSSWLCVRNSLGCGDRNSGLKECH